MSSRVQKGGPVFRPVVKSRSRTVPSTSRQASVGAESQNNYTAISTEYNVSSITPSTSQEPSGYATAHPESPIMVDRSNSTPIMNYTSSRISLRPPLISSSSNKFISPPSLPAVTETRGFRTSILVSNSSVPTSTINSTVDSNSTLSVPSGVDSQKNQSSFQTTTVQSANLAASTTTVSSITPSSNEEDVPDASTRQKRQSKALKGTKKRKALDKGDDDDTTRGESPPKQQRTRASSSTPRPRKRVPSPLPYDADADPGEDIDPTSMTMAALCTDTGQGRVSRKAAEILTNHAAWKIKNREKRAHMRSLMELKKYGREEESEHGQGTQTQPAEDATTTSIPGTFTAPIFDDTGNGFDYSQDLTTSRYNVQVRIGPNGETVIDEESLVVDRVENDGTEDYTHVIESDHTKFVNSGTYGKRYRGSRWSIEETELFYDALSQYGENYELIAYVLPGRDRKSCKNKFKAEDKKNHIRIDHCLNNSIPVDMEALARMTGKDFSGPVPEIRVPSRPTAAPSQEGIESETNVASRQKRSRSKSQGGIENGVVVVGDANTFQN